MLLKTLMWIVWFPSALAAPLAASPQGEAGEVLDRAIETLGGEVWLGVEDVYAKGRYYQFQRGQLAGADVFEDYVKFPDKERTEFGEDGERVRINNGDRGWNVTDGNVEAQIPEQVTAFREEFEVSLDYLLRNVLSGSEISLQYVGRDTIGFSRVDVLELRDEDRTRIGLYIDRSSGRILQKTVRRLSSPQVHEEIYSNYHEIDGVLTPLLVTRYTDGVKTMEIRFETVRYNRGMDDGLFLAEVSEEDGDED
jgi:hypothetical protein